MPLVGEEDAAPEQVGVGASVHLPLEHLIVTWNPSAEGAVAEGRPHLRGSHVHGSVDCDEGAFHRMMRLTWPSTTPELQGRVSLAVTASWSRRRPATKDSSCGWPLAAVIRVSRSRPRRPAMMSAKAVTCAWTAASSGASSQDRGELTAGTACEGPLSRDTQSVVTSGLPVRQPTRIPRIHHTATGLVPPATLKLSRPYQSVGPSVPAQSARASSHCAHRTADQVRP